MRYRTFLVYNAAGGIVRGAGCVLLGYLAAASYQRIASTFGTVAAIVAATRALAGLIVWPVGRHRRDRSR